jgi:hypothetical protein
MPRERATVPDFCASPVGTERRTGLFRLEIRSEPESNSLFGGLEGWHAPCFMRMKKAGALARGRSEFVDMHPASPPNSLFTQPVFTQSVFSTYPIQDG